MNEWLGVFNFVFVGLDVRLIVIWLDQVALLQAEVERVKGENHRLKDKLEEVNNNYNALKMHMMKLMQEQKEKTSSRENKEEEVEEKEQEEEEKKLEENGKSREGLLVPRQFMDLGLGSMSMSMNMNHVVETSGDAIIPSSDDPSRSSLSSCQEAGSGSLGNNVVEANREDTIKLSAETQDKLMSGVTPNKVDDQVEATMRKTRVSVRARSEAPMVRSPHTNIKYHFTSSTIN